MTTEDTSTTPPRLPLEMVAPDVFEEWKRRAVDDPAWGDYSLLLNAFGLALRRAPLTVERCTQIEMGKHLNMELAYLSDALFLIFPDGVMCEKTYDEEGMSQEEGEVTDSG